MNNVCACLDGQSNAAAVLEGAVWAARRLDAPLELVHALEPVPDAATLADYSGAIGLGAQEHLLDELSALDARRATLAQAAGRTLLEGARDRAAAALTQPIELHLRHGDLTETLLELHDTARLFVLGERFRPGAQGGRWHPDHHVERVVRAVRRPVLVVPGARFDTPSWAVIAFDGSATAMAMVERVAGSPLLRGLPLVVATVGTEGGAALDAAAAQLSAAGLQVETRELPGTPETALPALLQSRPGGMLAMGAYGHSRIREFVLGSTTSTMLRCVGVPMLVLR